jgi:choline dehydrogenase-like flavoprotein
MATQRPQGEHEQYESSLEKSKELTGTSPARFFGLHQIDYPVMIGQSLMDPTYDWCLKTVPQKHSNDRVWILPRGKVLGGSSALNFL